MYKKIVFLDSPYTLAQDPNFVTTEIQDIYLEVDSTGGAVVINLPDINDMPYLNAKVYVADIAGTAQANNITIYNGSTVPDLINGLDAPAIIDQNKGSIKLEIVQKVAGGGEGMWLSVAGNGQTMPLKRVTVTATEAPVTYNAIGDEDIIACYPTGGAISIVLAAADRPIKETVIKDEGGTANTHNITVTAHAGDSLDAATVISAAKGSVGTYNAGPGETTCFTFAPNL